MFDVNTLIRQLGTALPMLGAHSLAADAGRLQFGIKGCKRGNKIVIHYTPADTYTIELWKIRGTNFAKVETQSDVYADQLHPVIKSLTGLDTRL